MEYVDFFILILGENGNHMQCNPATMRMWNGIIHANYMDTTLLLVAENIINVYI